MDESRKEQQVSDDSNSAPASDQSAEGAAKLAHNGVRRNRFASAALIVDPGAVNPSGIAYAIIDACCEARADGVGTRDDAAVRLMVTQLAWICRAYSDLADCGELLDKCRRRAID